MAKARDFAMYIMDKYPEMFTEELVRVNGLDSYAGNIRLNKYLHIAQNVHIALTGEPLFEEALYAYPNGGVVREVQRNYRPLLLSQKKYNLTQEEIRFIDQICNTLKNASLQELIDISHQDEEWIEKKDTRTQRMDSLSRAEEYREQYNDIITLMELGLC